MKINVKWIRDLHVCGVTLIGIPDPENTVNKRFGKKRLRYFAAAIAMHCVAGGTFHGGLVHHGELACQWGWHNMEGGSISPGGLTLVLTWLMAGRGVASMGGGGKAKVSLLPKPLELQFLLCSYTKGSEGYNNPSALTQDHRMQNPWPS